MSFTSSVSSSLQAQLNTFYQFRASMSIWAAEVHQGRGFKTEVLMVDSGSLVCAEHNSFATKANGLGLEYGHDLEADRTLVQQMLDWYKPRVQRIRFETPAWARVSLHQAVQRAGFLWQEPSHLLHLPTSTIRAGSSAWPSDLEFRPFELDQPDALEVYDAIMRGYDMEPNAGNVEAYKTWYHLPNHKAWIVYAHHSSGQWIPVAATSVLIYQNMAYLSGACVLPSYRGQGIHGRMVQERLRYLQSKPEVEHVVMMASPTAISAANALKAGFQVIDTYTQYSLDLSTLA